MSNLSEKEKKALEFFKNNLEDVKELGKKYGFHEEIKNNEILLNYIDRLQKENEELKKKRNLDNELLKNIVKQEKRFVSKDKIKDKIKELEYDLNKMEKQEQFKVKIYSPIDIIKAQILELVEILEGE